MIALSFQNSPTKNCLLEKITFWSPSWSSQQFLQSPGLLSVIHLKTFFAQWTTSQLHGKTMPIEWKRMNYEFHARYISRSMLMTSQWWVLNHCVRRRQREFIKLQTPPVVWAAAITWRWLCAIHSHVLCIFFYVQQKIRAITLQIRLSQSPLLIGEWVCLNATSYFRVFFNASCNKREMNKNKYARSSMISLSNT